MQVEHQLTASLKEIDDLKAALGEHAIVAITDPQGKIGEQANIEEALRKLHGELEKRIQQRTAELTRVNNALQEAQALYHSLVEQIPAGIFRKDATGRYVFVNSWFCQLSGTKPADYLGKTSREFLRELAEHGSTTLDVKKTIDLAASGDEHHATIMQTGAGIELDEERILVDGRKQYLHVVKVPVFNSDGKVVGTQGMSIDITAHKQAEEAVRQSETRYHTLFDTMIEGFCTIEMIFDTDGKAVDYRFLEINPAFEKQTGLHNAQGKLMRDLAPNHEVKWFENYGKIALTGEPAHFENEAKALGRHYDVYANRVGGPESRKVAILFNDITEHKHAEHRLATQSAISRALAEANTLNEATPKIMQAICESEGWDFGAIWAVDKKANKLRCLEAWHRPEIPAEELEAKTRELTFALNVGLPGRVWAFGKPLLIPEIAKDDNYPRMPFATKIGLHSALAFPIALEDEIIGVMDFLGREIREADEKTLEMFLGIGRQIGSFFKRKQIEEQFRQLQKMEGIGQLAGGVAHDFNNILAVIQMQSDLLKAEGSLSPAQSEFAEEIRASTQRAAALTRQLLLFSRKETLQPYDLDLNQSINDMTKMLRRTIGEDIQLQFKFAMQPLFVHADASMMDQVLMNLAVNSRDAMPKGGQLIIETSAVEFDEAAASHSAQVRPGSFVCLSVGDTGCGIPPEILPKIFEPFFTTKDVGKGTGLGLATVFGIVQQHKGWINVYSEVGHGTTFRVYLPRLARISDQKFVPPTVELTRSGNETILLVEDEPRLRASVRNVLSRLGYNVLEASDGASALEAWKKHRNEVHFAQKVWNQQRDEIHLLLTDMVMPGGMTGKELGERLLKENPKLKVIYASGYSAEIAGRGFPLKEGVNFLTKPFQASKLAQTVRNCLDKI
jgi:PAS domain S-box-containing protein